ncbi:RNA polymerase sigma factor SigJ [Blastopirellula marina]|uniref:RNA polymerase sigma factor SigJ n=1 Tax=Blastopirellula marina TaxID=124 RepID=A0A2S8F6K0_9BACT|nr:RNA polymerase sigma factor SigJ [Blastopirellula marina]PQO27789.1 RNA polymerase sigma factor SigJ [Blastopirellula marina]PTL41529.1 RNA polymerase sigma factor SigJ [Blastopirellula marina]
MVSGHEFETLRKGLIGFSYRMLGSMPDAEDIVQEAYVRWEQAGRPELESPRSWYLKVCARLCLDRVKSVRYQREKYVGPWLPEPMLADHAEQTELDETISLALMMTIERLTPTERAAFILHDVFGYEFGEVAEIVGLKPDHCRQLACRAREHLRGEKQRGRVDVEGVQRISDAFFQAVQAGDLAALRMVLTEDVTLYTDGGGKVSAAKEPVLGFDRVTKFLIRVFQNAQRETPFEMRTVWFNGSPGVVCYLSGEVISAFQFELLEGRIISVFVHRNPDKLAPLDQAAKQTLR